MPCLLGAGVLALVARHANSDYREETGYVVQDPGGDIADLPAEVLDLEGAQAKCTNNEECNAISFSGSSETPKVYYKRDASIIYNDCWKSYSKNGKWEQFDGFLPVGADDLQEFSGPLDKAKQACQGNAKCKGFSVRDGSYPQIHYLKQTWSQPHNDCWKTYVKDRASQEAGEQGEEASAPAYYAASEEAPAEEAAAPAYYAASEEAPAEEAAAPTYYAASEEAPAEEAAAPAYYKASEEAPAEEAAAPTYYA